MKNTPNIETQPEAQVEQPAGAMDAMRQMKGKLAPLLFLMTLMASSQQAQAKEKNGIEAIGGISVDAPIVGLGKYDHNNDGYAGTGDNGHHWVGLGVQAAYKARLNSERNPDQYKQVDHDGRLALSLDIRDLIRVLGIGQVMGGDNSGATNFGWGVGAGLDTDMLDIYYQFLKNEGRTDHDVMAAFQASNSVALEILSSTTDFRDHIDYLLGAGISIGSGPVKWYAEALAGSGSRYGDKGSRGMVQTGFRIDAKGPHGGLPRDNRRNADRGKGGGGPIHMR